jgi:hypothetical protein
MSYETVDEAVEIANGTRYGLGASVFGPDQQLCLNVAKRLECGMVAVNDFGVFYLNQDLPFGGTKASGYGRFGALLQTPKFKLCSRLLTSFIWFSRWTGGSPCLDQCESNYGGPLARLDTNEHTQGTRLPCTIACSQLVSLNLFLFDPAIGSAVNYLD